MTERSQGTTSSSALSEVPVDDLARAMKNGLDGGAFSGSWEGLGARFQNEWRKAARRLVAILEAQL